MKWKEGRETGTKREEAGRGAHIRTAKLSTPLRFFRPLEKIFLMWFGRRCGFVEP